MTHLKKLFYTLLPAILCLSTAKAQNAPEQDCIGGIPVCQDTYYQPNAYSGVGAYTELDITNQGCLGSAEKNDVWYIVTVTGSGTLAFNITPNDLSDDYDFGVWDITNQGCSSIYNYTTNTTNPYLPVACNYSGVPGVTGITAGVIAPGTPFSPAITVTAGQTFAINVSDFSSSQSGYTLDFSPSTATIFDTVKPTFANVASTCSSSDSLVVTMSKPVQCASLDGDGSNLYITPGNPTITSISSSQCSAGGNTTTTFVIKLASPLGLGTFQLHARNGNDGNTLLSACGYSQDTTDVVTFGILSVPDLVTTPDTTTCVNSTLQLSAGITNPVPGITYSYQWSPNQYINDPNIANPTVNPQTDITYSVVVLQNGLTICSDTQYVNVAVLHGFNLPTKDTSICRGTTVQIVDTGDSRYSYHWTPNKWLSNNNIINPTTTPDSTITYTVTASYPGCVDSSQQYHVSVGTIPVINAGPDTTTCVNDSMQLNVVISNPQPSFGITWTPNQHISDNTVANPIIWPNASTPYIVTVRDNSVTAICAASDTVNVRVLQGFTMFNHDTSICIGSSVAMNVVGDPAYTYTWTPTDGLSNSNIAAPTATPDTSITYQLVASYPGCRDSVKSIHVDVQPIPFVNAGPDVAKCEWDTLKINATVSPQYANYTYNWSPGGDLLDSTVLTAHYYGDTTVMLHLTVTTAAGCKGIDSAQVTVWQGNFSAASNDTAICPNDSAYIMASGGVQYHWSNGFSLSDSTIANPVATPTATTDYTVYVTDEHNCLDTQMVRVTVHPTALMNLPDTVVIYPGETYQIAPEGNCLNYSWFPPLGLSATNISNPIASPDVNTKYIAYATTEEGCATTDSIIVNVDPGSLLALPNAFTPGNGPNSELKVLKRGIATLQRFIIFNRWGTEVFSTTDINQGWDGTYNGQPQPMGVYVYSVEAVTNNGRRFVKQGNVTLIR